MSAYMLLCNFTDQGVRTIKDAPKRRAAARELAKKLGIDVKASYLAIGLAGFQGKLADDHAEGVPRGGI